MDFTRINLAVKPSPEVMKEAIKLSNRISKEAESLIILDGINYFPHITIYSAEYPDKNLEKVLGVVDKLVRDFEPFSVNFGNFYSKFGYIDITLEKSEIWEKLHEVIVQELNPYRENHIREKYKLDMERGYYSQLQKENIIKYGSPDLFTLFRPHLTISRLKDETVVKELVQKLDIPIQTFQVKN